jgi:uncharacterized membrane protein YcaP (DUF421 family)
MHLLEIAGRVALLYLFCLLLLRIAGRRELSQLSPIDLMAMLLLSETVSPALTGGDDSVAGGLVAAATLVGLSIAVAYGSFRSRRLERAIQGRALVVIENGKVRPEVMRHERITNDELQTALHAQGLLSVDQVRRAFVEPGGEITIIKKQPDS